MTRTQKTLGTALAALLAACAIAAPSAMAVKEFRSAVNHAIVKGTAKSPSEFHFGGITVKCGKSEFASTYPLEASETPQLALEASYENCTAQGGMTGVTIKMNGCTYLMTLEEGTVSTGGSTTHTQGKVHIQCPGGSKIEMIVGALCTLHFSAQEVKGKFDHKVEGMGNEMHFLTTSTVTGMSYTRTGSLTCGPANAAAEYTSSTTLQGYKTAEERVAIWIN